MIVLKYPRRNVQPAPAIFPFLTVRTKFYSAVEVAQLNVSAVVNMKVHVKEVHPPQEKQWLCEEVLRLLFWRL